MNNYVENLKRQAEENPLAALGVGAVALTAVSKLLQAVNDRNNSRTWAKEVERRRVKTYKS